MITDELRKYTEEQIKWLDMTKVHYSKLFSIADRIDVEHQKAIRELNNLADASVLLPVDADGVPIRFGDKVTVSWSEKVYEVRGFSYTQQLAGGKRTIWVDVYSLEKMGNIPLCSANSCHHYHEPTVEDVLREMMREASCNIYADGSCEMGLTDEQLAKYAQRLQLREETE